MFLLALVCIGAFLIRADGIKWPKFHPDEGVIGMWIEDSTEHLYIQDRVYPNGFFVLARPFVMLAKAVVHIKQQWDYFCGSSDRIPESKPNGVLFGRWFNVWAGTLTGLVIFLLVSRMARSQWAGLMAACLIGFTQYAVEHSHYAETDIAALLILSVSFLCLVMAVDLAALRWFLLAALSAGFAAGTKFTLVVLVPIIVIETILFAVRRHGGRGWRHIIGLICLTLLLFSAGFTIANPAVVLHFNWFWDGLKYEQQRVYQETITNLGAFGAQPSIKYLHHFWLLNFNAKTLGLTWLGLIAAALPCLALNAARRYLSVLIIFPVLFAFYWIFTAPWVRSQEFLFFLPSCAALAVIPLVVLWQMKSFLCRFLCLAVAVAALALNACHGVRVSELFGWKDTRLIAREWLQMRLPVESRLAGEFYAEKAATATMYAFLNIQKVEEKNDTMSLLEGKADYLLRAANISGRGLRHPLTGALYPAPQRNFERFMRSSTLLAAWAPLPARSATLSVAGGPPPVLATFASPVIELYGLKHFEPTVSLQAEAAQPALIVNVDQNPVGRQTFCKVGRRLGCAGALLVDRLSQTIAIGGPEPLEGKMYLVLNTAERPAIINVRGFGLRRKISLDPYDTAVVPLQRTKRTFCKKPFETVTLWAEPVQDVLYIPCFARVVFTASEAVRIFLNTGRADRIQKYFSEKALADELSMDLQYLVASRLGINSATAANEQKIADLTARMEQCRQADPASVLFNGVSGYYFNQFARARLQPLYDFGCGPERDEYVQTPLQKPLQTFDLQLSENDAGEQKYCASWQPPVLIADGCYELRGEMMAAKRDPANAAVPIDIYPARGSSNKLGRIDLQPGKWMSFAVILQPHREIQPCLEFVAPVAVELRARNVELVWNLADVLSSIRYDLTEAGNTAAHGQTHNAGGNLKNQPQFGPWLKLVEFNFDAQKKEAQCIFEALQNDIPPLAVTFWLKRHGEWRRKQTQSLAAGKQLGKGEKIVLAVRLNEEAFKPTFDIQHLGVGIETDVLWHAGAIPTLDQGDVVPFAGLVGENRKGP